MVALVNNTLARYGGDTAIAAFGVIFRVVHFVFMPMMGITQGLQPILGFNYGAGQYNRVKQSFNLASIIASVYGTICVIIMVAMPGTIFSAFSRDTELVSVGTTALRYMVLMLPLIGFQVVGSGLFQALGKAIEALVLSLSRQVLILIPMVIVLPFLFGIKGVWLSFPFSDTLSFVITLLLVIAQMRKLHPLDRSGLKTVIEGEAVEA